MSFGGFDKVKHPGPGQSEAYYGYTCGHCGREVSGIVVATYQYGDHVDWLLCPSCGKGSVHSDGVFPRPVYGVEIDGLPDMVKKAYQEARNCMSVTSYTACELICRSILMHVSVEKGADINQSFEAYVSFLEKNGYITPVMKDWVKLIKEHGNKAAHKLESPDRNRAECTFMFTLELLRLIYEMNHVAGKYISKK
jgi:hypothetical protein